MGSVVSYSNQAKIELLGVGRESLEKFGAVSEIVAQEMAQGVRHRFHTDWGISVTGIAGPTGGTPGKPVGTVWIAMAGPKLATPLSQRQTKTAAQPEGSGVSSQKGSSPDPAEFAEARKHFFKGDRKQIQQQAVEAALNWLLNTIEGSAPKS